MAGWRDQTVEGGADSAASGPEPLFNYGAPGPVRMAVGAARARDRLATLQKFYPDAKPIGRDNFIYTDPATARPTIYNPGGLDRGDFPSITGDALEVLGQAGGAVAGLPLGLGGSLAGAALGGAGARAVIDTALRLGGMPQSATMADRATDTAKDLVGNMAGEAGGMAVQALPSFLARAMARPDANVVADAAQRLGIQPTVGSLSVGPMASTENMAANVLPASRAARMQTAFNTGVRDAAVNAIPGPHMGPGEAMAAGGRALKEGADQGYARFRALRQNLDNSVYAAFPPTATVPTTGLQQVAQTLQSRIAQAPETFGPALQPVLDRINNVLSDAQRYGGRLPLQTQRNIRTLIGQELETDATTALTPEAQRYLRDAYRSMTDDLRGAAAAQSPEALRLLNRHDRLVRAFRGSSQGVESVADSLDKILKTGSDEAAYSALMSPSGGVNRMQNVLNRLDAGQRQVVANAVWNKMLTTPQGNFNLSYMLGQYNKMDPAARKLLFGRSTNMSAMDDLMTVVGAMREADRSRNFSNTAYTLLQATLGEKALEGITAKIAGAGAGANFFPTETIGAVSSGYLLSEAFHNPAVARALADAARGGKIEVTESLRRSVARALTDAGVSDVMGTGGEPQMSRDSTNSENANAAMNGTPMSGWRQMSTTP